MRIKYLRLGVLFVSVFGLVSCSSDKSNQNSDETTPTSVSPVGKVEIENLDTTFQHLAKTKKLRVGSQLNLNFENDERLDEIQTKVSCQTNKRQETLINETFSKYTKKIPVVSIVPIKVFVPSTQDPEILCDFKIEALENGVAKVKIQINEVLLLETDQYANLQLDFLRAQKRPYLKRSELVARGALPMFTGGQAHLLCEFGEFKVFNLSGELSWEEIINPSAFLSTNTQLCRITLDNKGESRHLISASFYLQQKEGRLRIKARSFPSSGLKINWSEKKLASITIENRGDYSSFMKISDLSKSKLSLSPVYYQVSNNQFFSAPDIQTNIYWEVENLKQVSKGKRPHQSVYKIEPGETASLELLADDNWSCPEDLFNGFGACGSRPMFTGYLFRYSRLPKISESHFSDYKNSDWTTHEINLRGTHPSANEFTAWAVDVKAVNSCSMIQQLPNPGRNVQLFHAPARALKCN